MSESVLQDKENVKSSNDFGKESEIRSTCVVLKPSQRENLRQLTPSKAPKVTLKDSPNHQNPIKFNIQEEKCLDSWEEIRTLDEVENWTERTQVVTKEDHQLHLDSAKGILDNIVESLPCYSPKKQELQTDNTQVLELDSEGVNSNKMDDLAGPLDPAIASLNSLLKAGEEEEEERAFSPIGSDNMSPDCETMVTNDFEKLLVQHDDPSDIEIPSLELFHGSKIDAYMDSKFSGRHLDEVAAKLDELKLSSTKSSFNEDQQENKSNGFDLQVKPRGAMQPSAAVAPQEEKLNDDFDNLPIKPRGAKQPPAAAMPQNDDFSNLPVKPRGAKQPPAAAVPQNDDFNNLPVKPRGAKQPPAVTMPQNDDFDNLPIKPRGSKQQATAILPPVVAVVPQEQNSNDDFDNLPIKPRGVKQKPVEIVPDELSNDDFDDLPIKPRGFKQPTQEDKSNDNINELPIKPRDSRQANEVIIPQEEKPSNELPVKPRGVSKPKTQENGSALNENENKENTTKQLKKSDKVNDEEETFKKPMPPKPWKQKKKKVPANEDPFAIMFSEPVKGIFGNEKPDVGSEKPVKDEPVAEEKPVGSRPSEKEMNAVNKDMSSADGVLISDQQDDFGFSNDDFSSGNDFSLELDYLEKFGNSNNLDRLSALARQSLYVKFDPLCKGRSPDQQALQRVAAEANASKQASGKSNDLLMNTPPNRQAQTTNKLSAIKESDGSHANGLATVDSLLTFSPSSKKHSTAETNKDTEKTKTPSTEADDSSLVQPLLFSKIDIETAVQKEREALLKQTQAESQVKKMEVQEVLTKLQTEVESNSKLKQENDELKTVMQEYEKSIAAMIESSEKDKNSADESTKQLVKERDQLQADLNSVEAAFSDLHRRYDKMKGTLESFKKNEELLRKAAQEYQEKLRKSSEKYQMLKKHAEEKIETANIEINRVRRSNDSEMAVMRAALKKEQNKSASLEQAIEQKINENKELTAICDELIQRASGK